MPDTTPLLRALGTAIEKNNKQAGRRHDRALNSSAPSWPPMVSTPRPPSPSWLRSMWLRRVGRLGRGGRGFGRFPIKGEPGTLEQKSAKT